MAAGRAGRILVALAAVPAMALVGCSSALDGGSDDMSVLDVYAASSLTAPFADLARRFEAAHPGTQVRLTFAGSTSLLAQLQEGAPADVFASADTATMAQAVDSGLVAGRPQVFAANSMIIAVPNDNPAAISRFADLAQPDVAVVVCEPAVPCGAATERVEEKTGVTLAPVSEETAVADVLNKVVTGQADAGVVYVTDVAGADGSVTGVPIPSDDNATNRYPIAVLADSPRQQLAGEFEDLVLSPDGRRLLTDAGFAGP